MSNELGQIGTKVNTRYLIVGISVYILELTVIVVAQKIGATTPTAIGFSYIFGLLVSFGLQKFFTFGDKRTHHKILVPQILAFLVLVIFNFGFNIVVAKLMTNLLPAVIIRTLTLAVTTVWNFYLYKTRIFKKEGNFVY